MKFLGLINARGGSKGIPRKNIKKLNGKPLINWTIEEALKSKLLSDVIVSTEDEEISQISMEAGANVPFLRPKYLAQDATIQIDVIKHALLTLKEQGKNYDYVVTLQPTVPLRIVEDIDLSIEKIIESKADSLITVCDIAGKHPKTIYSINDDSSLEPFQGIDNKGVLRQNFKKYYWRNGAVYITKVKILLEMESLYGTKISFHEMPEERSFNLDSIFDWSIIEAYISTIS